jgi:hypothetical protein
MNNNDKTNESKKVSRRKFLKQVVFVTAAIGLGSGVTAGVLQRKQLRSANNMLRIGHYAPSIMQTLLEIYDIDNKNLVRYAGGLAGGIAGMSMECGGITAPLMFLSLQNDYTAPNTALDLIKKAQLYLKELRQTMVHIVVASLVRMASPLA